MQIPEEIYCPECKLHSCPETKDTKDRVKLICFWCDNEVKVLKKWKFDFGKYKGTYVEDCKDLNYLRWIIEEFKVKDAKDMVMKKRAEERLKELRDSSNG